MMVDDHKWLEVSWVPAWELIHMVENTVYVFSATEEESNNSWYRAEIAANAFFFRLFPSEPHAQTYFNFRQ